MSTRAPRRAGARVAAGGGALALAVLALAVLACVRIETAPGGIASLRLDPVAPAIVAGDTLRDSLGFVTRLRAVAFGPEGDTVRTDAIRYLAIPLGTDSLRATALPVTVDSLTGAVVAAPGAPTVDRVRLVARLGRQLQLLDTVDVVQAPTAFGLPTGGSATIPMLRYLCNEDRRTIATDTTIGTVVLPGTATAPLGTRLTRDSAGSVVGVRRMLVEYAITAPATIPVGTAPHGDRRPAVYVTAQSVDVPIRFDTTTPEGTARPRLRVVPTLLPRATWPDTAVVEVVARVRVGGAPGPVEVPSPVRFSARLVRVLPSSGAGSCP